MIGALFVIVLCLVMGWIVWIDYTVTEEDVRRSKREGYADTPMDFLEVEADLAARSGYWRSVTATD